ncbi:MAG: response regulator transcription factor [Meiothermus sp.]|uniref:response regulator transcription factor n=1 Tax=Meiothermus sp. TaxID=1955249 RepID=UPI0028CC6518|nr:response regulator transcription factor [Meiothermus sp.]MDT7920305.1 response regulator transcription factor [Meiothermus sp.]
MELSTTDTLNGVALVLVVEDEPEIAEILEGYLRREGFRTERASDGPQALNLVRAAQPDLVLLDLMLPEMDGLEVLRRIRNHGNTPVILVTARTEDLDKLLGLELGADDYITKPFSPREVVARVKAVLRRAVLAEAPKGILRVGPLEIDSEKVVARLEGVRLELTPTEFRLLETLARTPGKAFSRAELLEAALPDSDAQVRVVDVHLKNLRKKLEAVGGAGLLETVRGVGYRLWVEA